MDIQQRLVDAGNTQAVYHLAQQFRTIAKKFGEVADASGNQLIDLFFNRRKIVFLRAQRHILEQ